MFGESHQAVADEISADPIARREPLMRNDPLSNDLPARRDSQIRRAPNGTGLYDVLDLILDKGIVIDGFVRVSLVGIELLTIDLRIVVASVDTYLRYAEGVERLGVYKTSNPTKIPDMCYASGGAADCLKLRGGLLLLFVQQPLRFIAHLLGRGGDRGFGLGADGAGAVAHRLPQLAGHFLQRRAPSLRAFAAAASGMPGSWRNHKYRLSAGSNDLPQTAPANRVP